MGTESYTKGMLYEILVTRANKGQKTIRNGADSSLMTNLIDSETGVKQYKLPTTEKQFEKVKGHLANSLDKFLKMKLTDMEKLEVEKCKTDLSNTYSSGQLMTIVERALEATRRLKNN